MSALPPTAPDPTKKRVPTIAIVFAGLLILTGIGLMGAMVAIFTSGFYDTFMAKAQVHPASESPTFVRQTGSAAMLYRFDCHGLEAALIVAPVSEPLDFESAPAFLYTGQSRHVASTEDIMIVLHSFWYKPGMANTTSYELEQVLDGAELEAESAGSRTLSTRSIAGKTWDTARLTYVSEGVPWVVESYAMLRGDHFLGVTAYRRTDRPASEKKREEFLKSLRLTKPAPFSRAGATGSNP